MAQASDLLGALVDAAPMAAAVVLSDLTILAWNAAATDLTGWPAADVLGKRDPMLPPDEVERTEQVLAAWLEHPEQVERLVLRRLRPDGLELELTLESATPIEIDAGRGLALWFSEATDVDALLLQRNRLSRRLVGATHIEEVLPVLTTATRDVLGGTAAIVLRRCPPGEHLHGVRAFGMETEVAEQVQLDLADDIPWQAAADGVIADGTISLDGREHASTYVPMGPEGEGWVLAVCDTTAVDSSAHLRDLFRGVADEAWAALERVSLVTDLDGKIEILEATNRIASSVGLDLEHALDAVTRQAAEALSCERAAVYLTDPATGEVALAHVFASDASPEQLLAEDEGLELAEEVVRTGKEVPGSRTSSATGSSSASSTGSTRPPPASACTSHEASWRPTTARSGSRTDRMAGRALASRSGSRVAASSTSRIPTTPRARSPLRWSAAGPRRTPASDLRSVACAARPGVGVVQERDEASRARARAAAALRRFGHALHSRDADVDLLERVADAADAVTAQLEDVPLRHRDLSALMGQMWKDPVPDGAVVEHFEDCFVSGDWNPLGIGIVVHREGDEAVATVTLGPAYEGAPERSHGGIVAAIFDDVLGYMLRFLQQPAYTGELTVRYLAPTPVEQPLEFRARVERVEGRKIDTIAEAYALTDDGERTHVATGTARFIAIESYTPTS